MSSRSLQGPYVPQAKKNIRLTELNSKALFNFMTTRFIHENNTKLSEAFLNSFSTMCNILSYFSLDQEQYSLLNIIRKLCKKNEDFK